MDSGKTILSEGIELSDEEDVTDPAKGTLPYVFLDIKFTDGSTVSVDCTLSSIDNRSISLSNFSLWWALQLLIGLRDKKCESVILRADDMEFSQSLVSDIYISVMGSTCSLSLSRPSDE
jgi:hypothetical protein